MKIVRCITCMRQVKIKEETKKYRCVHCNTEYEYAEIIEDNLLEKKGENVD